MEALNKDQVVKKIQDAINVLGPSVQEEEVDLGSGKTTLLFVRLPFVVMDRLRLHAINAEGKFDKSLHVGAAARLVAASLCDNAGQPVMSLEQIMALPTPIVDALNLAAQKANGLTTEAKTEIAKKSEEVQPASSSSSSP